MKNDPISRAIGYVVADSNGAFTPSRMQMERIADIFRADLLEPPEDDPDLLEHKHWPWLAEQILAWPDRRVHPDRTMSIGTLHRMAAAVIAQAHERLKPNPKG